MKNQSKQCSHKPPHPSMHTPGFLHLCLGSFYSSINNHIQKLFQGWPVPVAMSTQLPSSSSQGPHNIFFPGKSNTTTADPRHCPTAASLEQVRCRQKCMIKMWKVWEGKQAEGRNAGGERGQSGGFLLLPVHCSACSTCRMHKHIFTRKSQFSKRMVRELMSHGSRGRWAAELC